ncbi:ClpXP protease specificity-enhancing factor [Motilimonas cestriensis]|uniref:ClpXP protease specificity-enhancing factor n=1 Tax=Motilimonas cestriensis TaxID=2742685 RepID=A0ABS8WAL2_9GAMM|nr:ClpXP protease specificity-enhancing factor [Motilimonas cestriensis]MCE2596084.1 ClpXP protease specificity-enhancing factor [Motilimonas cestriensis]
MTPNRPYLLRAFFDWILDNDMTPHLVVSAFLPHVNVPEQFIKDGKIVLNIAPGAVTAFEMDKEAVSFNARFSGSPFQVYIPMYAVEAIYARENGAGTMFPAEPFYEAQLAEEAPTEPSAPSSSRKGKPGLRVVK